MILISLDDVSARGVPDALATRTRTSEAGPLASDPEALIARGRKEAESSRT